MAELAASPDLEATCARALDLYDPHRIPILLHADDPVFLASSRGEACRVLSVVASWARKTKASFHLGSTKTVVQGFCADSRAPCFLDPPLPFPRPFPEFPAPLQRVNFHKWLGLRWSISGDWLHHAVVMIAACSTSVDFISSLLCSRKIPLAIAVILFNLKVESVLRFGRWLWALPPAVQELLDLAYARWARQLLQAKPWCTATTCFYELGWPLSTADRVAFDVALARFKLWSNPQTLAGHLFATSHSLPGSWACMSRTFLAQKGILDWPMWFEWGRERLGSYKHYVRQILQGDSCTDLTIALQSSLPWNIMIAQQALIRLRRKYVALGHVDGRESRAKVQQCIFCNKRYSNTLLHVLCACPSFASSRTQCLLHFDAMKLGVLFTSPDHGGFVPIAAFAAEVVGLADDYWRHR